MRISFPREPPPFHDRGKLERVNEKPQKVRRPREGIRRIDLVASPLFFPRESQFACFIAMTCSHDNPLNVSCEHLSESRPDCVANARGEAYDPGPKSTGFSVEHGNVLAVYISSPLAAPSVATFGKTGA